MFRCKYIVYNKWKDKKLCSHVVANFQVGNADIVLEIKKR